MRLHLAVIQPNATADGAPFQCRALASPGRHEFIWNDDYTAFRFVPLKWWDDASYLAYQAGDDIEARVDMEGGAS